MNPRSRGPHFTPVKNAAYLHLLTSHAPLWAVLFGLLLWLLGRVWRSVEGRRAALILFLLAGLLAGLAYASGSPALHALQGTPGWDRRAAEQHADLALPTLVVTTLLAVAAAGGLWALRHGPRLPRSLAAAVLGLSLLSAACLAWTSSLGGHTRHLELQQVP